VSLLVRWPYPTDDIGGIQLSQNASSLTGATPFSLSITVSQATTAETAAHQDIQGSQCAETWVNYFREWASLREPPGNTPTHSRPRSYITTSDFVTNCFSTRVSFGANKTYTACDGVTRLRFMGNVTSTGTSTFCVTQAYYNRQVVSVTAEPRKRSVDEISSIERPSEPVGAESQQTKEAMTAMSTSNPTRTVASSNTMAQITKMSTSRKSICSNTPENCVKRSAYFRSKSALMQQRPRCYVPPTLCEGIWAAINDQDEVGVYPGIIRHDRAISYPMDMMNEICPPPDRVCQAVMRKEVLIMYWPDSLRLDNSSNCGGGLDLGGRSGSALFTANKRQEMKTNTKPLVVTTDRITFRGVDLVKIDKGATKPAAFVPPSVLTGHFEFTSPTVYIAHHDISASIAHISYIDGTKEYVLRARTGSPTHTLIRAAGSMAVLPELISSIRVSRSQSNGLGSAVDAKEYVQQVAAGNFDPHTSLEFVFLPTYDLPSQTTLPLNLADLVDPVPASVYYDARQAI
jgi:hypothetical protein